MLIKIAERSLNQHKEQKLKEVHRQYELVKNGIHPITGEKLSVECVTSQGNFIMNAGENAAVKMSLGVQLYERLGKATMKKIRDFYNVDHLDVPLPVAIEIMLQQGTTGNNHWERKGELVSLIENSNDIQELLNLEIDFFGS
jgi:hypothetical protein